MACFIVPATEAVVSTVITKKMEGKEEKKGNSLHHKMKWLNNMLWGGSALLAFEHVWHGEVVPFFPFLTAASNSKDAVQILHEMGTVGVTMTVAVTLTWLVMVGVTNVIEKRNIDISDVKKAKQLKVCR